MHHLPPEGRNEGDPETAVVAARELRGVIVGLQLPKRLARLEVVGWMSREFEECPPRPAMLRLPRVGGGLPLPDLAMESIVADVVDVLKQKHREGSLYEKCTANDRPKKKRDSTN